MYKYFLVVVVALFKYFVMLTMLSSSQKFGHNDTNAKVDKYNILLKR